MKERLSVVLLDLKTFIIKLLCYYLALITWISIIIMCLSIILIPLFVYLKVETKWYDRPFGEAAGLGSTYENYAFDKWFDKWIKNKENKQCQDKD